MEHLQASNPEELESEAPKKSPLKLIMGFILISLMILTIVPYYLLKANPEPTKIPSFEEIVPDNIQTDYDTQNRISSREEIGKFITPTDPLVKVLATEIATYGCDSNKICQAKAIYYFIQEHFTYVSESDEFFQTFDQAITSRGGDCDDATILLANMYKAIGIPTQIVFVPGHVLVQIKLEDIPNRYINEHGWTYVDGTCYSCDFGELHYSYVGKEQYIVYV